MSPHPLDDGARQASVRRPRGRREDRAAPADPQRVLGEEERDTGTAVHWMDDTCLFSHRFSRLLNLKWAYISRKRAKSSCK